MDVLNKLIVDIELHHVEGIQQAFSNGIDPNSTYNDEPLIYELCSEYTRGPRFKDCVKVFVDAGLQFDDPALLAVLLNDAAQLELLLKGDPSLASKTYSMRCAYTPLLEASLMHICAEFNHLACALVLVQYGADIDAKAGVDEHGFGGQTPIFHTVNQNNHQSSEMFDFLLAHAADLHMQVKGLIWGKGYSWETFIPAVNPISYAMMGLLPQMHRDEQTISAVVSRLMHAAYGIEYVAGNVPNRYLLG
ncbi:ankyrin repeat domain-containing protein [Haliscomenobacter hydrossis]|uniref:Ankyrin n=1 Tax=Haliscomenobacter hydrossis (strain ATCC 27775 / DSM 1100 / LMG 10767 / O) TaxID=760192 RepID=F4KVY0_HALH1|nr:ankyrin repeat domain-containing protein [Haliscomenobacter hydrossis]AEE53555.1 Ankyrin [Haliscomenobacter hydrossis DSM 1100]